MDIEIETWINEMKIAILESNTDRAFFLTQNLPFTKEKNIAKDNDIESLYIIRELISQAIELMTKNRNDAQIQMEKIKKMRNFLI